MAVIGVIHGLGGTGATVQPLADLLTAAGHDVQVPTLPGHGTSPEDLVGIGWSEWLAAVPHAEVLVGQSMGASLALTVAAVNHHIRLVVAINPPMADEEVLEGLEWRRSRGHDWIDAPELAEGEVGYARLPITALIEMVEGVHALDLDAVVAPVLLVHGALDDSTDLLSLDVVAENLGGPAMRLVLPNSGHVATLGPDLRLLVAAIDEALADIISDQP
jgi:carboxylesterase